MEGIIRNQNSNEKEVLYQLKQLIQEIESQTTVAKDSIGISDLVSEHIKRFQDKSRQVTTIKSGFADFDSLVGGFAMGEFVVIGARPGMGKTQLLVNLSVHISASTPVLYFTFDLSEFLLTNRFISTLSGIAIKRILQGELAEEEIEGLKSVENKLRNHKILVNDSCNNSMSALRAHCQKQIEENGVKVIVVDYLQLMSSYGHRHNRESEIGMISRELRSIARDFSVCVIATSQLSRAVEVRGGAKYPQLSDLRESGAIEQDADKVIFIYRPEYYGINYDEDGNYAEGLTELIIAKNRSGGLGTVKILRDAHFTNFVDFDGYKEDFSFAQIRLDEVAAKNPHIKKLKDMFDLEEPPF